MEERLPVIKKAALAANVASSRIGQLKQQLRERDATIEQLRRDVASAMADAEKARERADKLEARFTQVSCDLRMKVWVIGLGQLKEQVRKSDSTIDRSRRNVASAMVDAGKARERADKLEARFTQQIYMRR